MKLGQSQNILVGLTDKEIDESRQLHGSNKLNPPQPLSLWKLFWEKFDDPILRILIIAAFMSLIIAIFEKITTGQGHFSETIGIFVAIALATGIGFWFEVDANKKFDLLTQCSDESFVKVKRNGKFHEITKNDIVVGDIVYLSTGDEIPADCILIDATALVVNESSLTGELAANKTTSKEHFDEHATYPSNQIYRGTNIISGHAVAQVVAVGSATEYGKVANKTSELIQEKTPLSLQLEGLAKMIGVVGLIFALITFIALFAIDVAKNSADYSIDKLVFIGLVIVASLVVSVKIWSSILYDGLSLINNKIKLPDIIGSNNWFMWLLYGVLTFIILGFISFLFGINPMSQTSWVSLSVAQRILQFFMIAVTLIVVAVPEGLPMSITLSLAMGMRRMLKSNNLVRKMHATETMGATTVICTDKTGTLTQNQMNVSQIYFPAQNKDDIKQLIQLNMALNSTADLEKDTDNNTFKVLGNPTEGALLLWLNNNNINYLSLRNNNRIIGQLPFDTDYKYMATIVEIPNNLYLVADPKSSDKLILLVKGAPERVMQMCSHIEIENGMQNIEEATIDLNKKLLSYQQKSMRTLGFAYKVIDKRDYDVSEIHKLASDLTFLGVVAIMDPIREDVPNSIKECLNSGISIKIVTGDTKITAIEIARQVGLWNDNDKENDKSKVITGEEFSELTDNEALGMVQSLKIMCRAKPTDKQRLVSLLQQNKEIVAVTGDGTNDAPALNQANIGLSMGSGTAVAKEASDIVLLDDSFTSIATAVMWGRSLYKNIQRFILFQLTINLTALLVVFFGTLFGFELPLTITQMLWVNIIMDTFAAAALASLPPSHDVMEDKPRNNSQFIITHSMKMIIFFSSGIFLIVLVWMLFSINAKTNSEYALSCFFTFFVFLQFWNLFNAKAFATKKTAFANMGSSVGFLIVLVLILVGQFLIVTFGGEVFRTVPISFRDWVAIILATSVVLWVGEILRFLRK